MLKRHFSSSPVQTNFTCKLMTIDASELSRYSANRTRRNQTTQLFPRKLLPRGTRGKGMFGYCCRPQALLCLSILGTHFTVSRKRQGTLIGDFVLQFSSNNTHYMHHSIIISTDVLRDVSIPFWTLVRRGSKKGVWHRELFFPSKMQSAYRVFA
jgi:hypothetical protein